MASTTVTPLLVGTVFALGALAYVLWPLIAGGGRRSPSAPPSPRGPTSTSGDARLRAMETARYASVVAPIADVGDAAAEDVAEAEIRRARAQQRVCPVCGPRPEPGARYCSRCGAVLV